MSGRTISIITLIAAAVGLILWMLYPVQYHMTNRPSLVSKGASGQGLQASFEIGPANYVIKAPPRGFGVYYTEPSIRSRGMRGGACMVADLNASGIPNAQSCSNDGQCQGGLPNNGWRGYCVESRCWVKPSPDASFCLRGRATGTHMITPDATATNPVYQRAGGRPVNWRLLTCLNGYDDTTGEDSFDCAGGGSNRLSRLGDINSVP